MALLSLLILIRCISILVNGAGGPYPPSFDCPMRQLALEFAQNIQPFLSLDQLQEIAGYNISGGYMKYAQINFNLNIII